VNENRTSSAFNFVSEIDADRKEAFRGSDTLSWKRNDKGAVNLIIVGRLARWTLASALSDYEPAYRVELDLDRDTASALKALLESGPLSDADNVHFPIVEHSTIFSAKLKTLRLEVNDPFPYLFDESELDGRDGTPPE